MGWASCRTSLRLGPIPVPFDEVERRKTCWRIRRRVKMGRGEGIVKAGESGFGSVVVEEEGSSKRWRARNRFLGPLPPHARQAWASPRRLPSGTVFLPPSRAQDTGEMKT